MATYSGIGALVPVPGLSTMVDLIVIKQELNFYKSQLGLPMQNSKEFRMMTPEDQVKLRKFCVSGTIETGKLMAKYASTSIVVEEFSRYIPLLGTAIASSISFCTTYYFLEQCLNEMEEIALACQDETKRRVADDLDIG